MLSYCLTNSPFREGERCATGFGAFAPRFRRPIRYANVAHFFSIGGRLILANHALADKIEEWFSDCDVTIKRSPPLPLLFPRNLIHARIPPHSECQHSFVVDLRSSPGSDPQRQTTAAQPADRPAHPGTSGQGEDPGFSPC